MNRRDILTTTAATVVAAASSATASNTGAASAAPAGQQQPTPRPIRPLTPPATGKIPVAFLISERAQVIDFAGPWEVFQDVEVPGRGTSMDQRMPFDLFTVAESTRPIRASGGLRIVPDHDFSTAPAPKLIVIPAQSDPTTGVKEWLRKASQHTDVTMSVCVGAFVLGAAGMLSGQAATTHHAFYDKFARAFPDAQLKRGVRFVENDNISTAGGLTSGIDLALHVVERYFGREVAQQTAVYMEHDSELWKV